MNLLLLVNMCKKDCLLGIAILTLYSLDLIFKFSPQAATHFFFLIKRENLVLDQDRRDQDNKFYLISLSTLIACLLGNMWISQR